MIGQQFGDLTVIAKSDKRRRREILWECQHITGLILYASKYDLVHGRVTGQKLKGRSKDASYNRLLNVYKKQAASRNLSFKLSKEDFIRLITSDCHYCGNEPIKRNPGSGHLRVKAHGIDRANNHKGYTLKNSVPCCAKCNSMKSKYSYAEFLEHINSIYEHQNDGNDSHTKTPHIVERNAGMRGSVILKQIYDLVERDNFQKADIYKFLEALVEEHIDEA